MRQNARGFTLIETILALGLIVLIASVALPTLSNIGRAELRKMTRLLAGTVRATYDLAALTGDSYRIAFDFEKNQIRVEKSGQTLMLEPGKSALVQAGKASSLRSQELQTILDAAAAEAEDEGDSDSDSLFSDEDNPVASLFGMGDLHQADAASEFTQVGDVLDLGDELKILDVTFLDESEPVSQGIGYLYFFPHGYTQDALIHFEGVGRSAYTVKVWALTGKAEIFNRFVERER